LQKIKLVLMTILTRQFLLSILRDLSEAPDDQQKLNRVVEAFDSHGTQQGPVLTYAPFINTLLSSTDLSDLS